MVVAAALTNRRAAAARLVEEAAKRRLDVEVVCAGVEKGTAFSLEDTAAAGSIVEAVRELDATIALTDEAWAALHLWHWYRGDAGRIFGQSKHGRALLEAGFAEDLRYAGQVDVSSTVPLLFDDGGVNVLRVRKPRARRGGVTPAS